MNGSQVGSIWYEVDADASKLVNSSKEADGSLDRLTKTMGKTDGSAAKLETKMDKVSAAAKRMTGSVNSQSSAWSGLTKIVATYLSLRTLQAVIAMSDKYMEMASRIKNATASTEEYEAVQARLLETANGTYRNLSEAQEVYLATADTLRDLGYTTSDVLDITDSLSYAFVRDAARADQATTAIDAYSKALMKGKVEADAWASIVAAAPSIIGGIAAVTGRTTEEIRKLGATGKLSVEALTEAWRQNRQENKSMADAMDTTVNDAFVKLRNSMTLFIGKVNESSGASGLLVENVSLLAKALQDPEVIRAAQDLAGGVVGAFAMIASSAKEVVGVVRFMAEELAAALHGAAADDIVRLEERLENLQKARAKSFLRRLGNGYSDKELDEEIKKLKELVRLHHERSDARPLKPQQSPQRLEIKTRTVEAENLKDNEKAQKKLTDAQKAAIAVEKDLAAARASDAEYLDQLETQLQHAALSGEELAVAQAKIRLSPIADDATIQAVENYARSIYRAADGGKLLRDLHDQLATRQRQFARELDSFGQGTNVRELNAQLAQVEDSYQNLIKQRRASSQGLSDLELQQIQEALDTELQMVRDHHQAKLDIQADWKLGALDSLRNYAEDSANIYDQIAGAVSGAFRSMEDALTEFVQTGKLDFKSLVDSILADLIRISIRQSITGQLAGALGGVLGSMGSSFSGMGSSYSAPAMQSSSGLNFGFDNFTFAGAPGRRANGGAVAAGGLYRINERGSPEILNTNGKQFLMMGQRAGRVEPMDKSGAGATSGRSQSTTVNNYFTIQAPQGTVSRATQNQISAAAQKGLRSGSRNL